MTRNPAAAQGSARGPRTLALALLGSAGLGAGEPGRGRPPGTSPTEAVAIALELALVAPEDGGVPAAGLDEARVLLGAPTAEAEDLRRLAVEAATAWSGRADPSRRLVASWAALQDPGSRRALLERPDPEGALARLAAGAAFGNALLGSRHLPPAQAEALLAGSQGEVDPVRALEGAGRALTGVALRTGTAQRQVTEWLGLLAVAGVPGPLPWDVRLAGRGEALEEPMAPLVRVSEEEVEICTRSLVSWRDGRLVLDPGPPPERFAGWDHEAWTRWGAVSERRATVALAGVTALGDPGVAAPPPRPAPLLVLDPDLPLARLGTVLADIYGEGVGRVCLLVRNDEDGGLRRLCLDFAPSPPTGATIGLIGTETGTGTAVAWTAPGPGLAARDLARALDEAGAAGVTLALAVGEGAQSR